MGVLWYCDLHNSNNKRDIKKYNIDIVAHMWSYHERGPVKVFVHLFVQLWLGSLSSFLQFYLHGIFLPMKQTEHTVNKVKDRFDCLFKFA